MRDCQNYLTRFLKNNADPRLKNVHINQQQPVHSYNVPGASLIIQCVQKLCCCPKLGHFSRFQERRELFRSRMTKFRPAGQLFKRTVTLPNQLAGTSIPLEINRVQRANPFFMLKL